MLQSFDYFFWKTNERSFGSSNDFPGFKWLWNWIIELDIRPLWNVEDELKVKKCLAQELIAWIQIIKQSTKNDLRFWNAMAQA